MTAGLEDLFDDPVDELPPPPDTEPGSEASAPEPAAAEEPADETPEVEAREGDEPPGQEQPEDEAAQAEEQAATGEPAPSVDWAKRYADLRRQQMPALSAAQQRAEFAESQLAALMAERNKPQAQQDFSQIADDLRAFATEQGWDDASTSKFARIISATAHAIAEQQTQGLSSQMQAQTEAQRQLYASQQMTALEQANDETLAAFQADNPDIPDDHQDAMLRFLGAIGEVETGPDGRPVPTPDEQGMRVLSREALDAALEAARNPAVADVLTAQPEWAYTAQGLALARRLASDSAPVVTTQRTTTAEVDRKLAAAQTLSGPSGTRPGAAPVRDEIAELLEPEPQKFFSR